MSFNRNLPHGKITPPMAIDKWNTAAHYDQDGVLYDAHGVACDPALRDAPKKAAAPAAEAPAAAEAAPKAAAKPGKAAKKAPDAPAAAAAPAAGTGVDLAAWARGQKDYLPPELFKAIRGKFNVQLSQRRDAIELLIKEGVVTAAEARKDIV
jgi:hypothetical protein